MDSPKLWWYVEKVDHKKEYIFDSYESISQMFNDLKLLDFAVVHPDNEKQPSDYREENKKHIFYIKEHHQQQIKELKEMNTPDVILQNSMNVGHFGVYTLIFDEEA